MQRLATSSFVGTTMPNVRIKAPKISARTVAVKAAVKVGDKAPSFTLKDQNGKDVNVKFGGNFGGKNYAVFFYPKDSTPGCTLEAKAFRDSYANLKKLGCEVVGISSGTLESKKEFCDSLDLPYKLLNDENDKVRNMYGVPKDLLGLLPGRVTYVIDKTGTVVKVFNNQFKPEQHVEEAIKALA